MINAILFSVLNAFRGCSILNRWSAALLMGVAYGAFLIFQGLPIISGAWVGIATFLGMWAALAPGWGKGFAAFHGRLIDEVEIPFLDNICDKAYPLAYRDMKIARKWGVLWMTMRGAFFYPVFVLLAVLTGNYWLFLTGLLTLSMGLVYGVVRYIPEKHAVRVAEAGMGFIWGAALCFA